MKKTHESMLQQIEHDLIAEKYDCSLEPSSEQIPNDQLIVFIGNDVQEREKIMIITAAEQIMEEEKKADSYHLIHFLVPLPFALDPVAATQTGSTLLFINRLLELPGFEMGELEEKVYYRYALFTQGKTLDKFLLYSIIGNIMMTLDLFSGIIENVATGKTTFNDLLEEMLNATK